VSDLRQARNPRVAAVLLGALPGCRPQSLAVRLLRHPRYQNGRGRCGV